MRERKVGATDRAALIAALKSCYPDARIRVGIGSNETINFFAGLASYRSADYSVEDCFVWQHNGKYYALAKDMSKGGLTGYTDGYSYALYESTDGVNWPLSENKLAFDNKLTWENGEVRSRRA